ncbi:reverse transcriptase family protein [Alkalihalobacillus pseudalcaliphilus]|uniref:reverse transcriptase family protein n=1 Tax=Alkalihalobacillus pseudalcaliphilus TaxID=79884 RepID=UPI00064E0EA5|nr:reverse transcriptase family protein [Alkalihalobacillus pseudalcaliphilus]KMK75265.1 hypothetical protein AB990_17755 [Alkalihalobacillus pseudalcaliphilus]
MDIIKLEQSMRLEGHRADYIKLCKDYAINLKRNELPVIFNIEHLAKLIGINADECYAYYQLSSNLYNELLIPKRTGGQRVINAPSENLKYIQRWILDNILSNVSISVHANGFINERSIVTNAIQHIGKKCVINLDIKDFFPSITYIQVYNLFNRLGYSRHLSMVFTGLCTLDNKLPQGAPTSPYLSNIICKNLDDRLSLLASHINASYSRYADDITFSGDRGITSYIKLIKKVVQEERFLINEKKVRVQFQYHRQMVTGLIVNEKLSIPKKTRNYLRQEIYYCQKYGVKDHMSKKGLYKTNYQGHLTGLAQFIKMVDSKLGEEYLKSLDKIDWES